MTPPPLEYNAVTGQVTMDGSLRRRCANAEGDHFVDSHRGEAFASPRTQEVVG